MLFNPQSPFMLVRDADYQRSCEGLVSLDKAIVAAFIISGGIRGSHIKLAVPALKEDDAQRLSEQTSTVIDIVRSNERLFGQLGYVLVHHESVDGMFFPVDDSMTILIGLIRPYDQDRIAKLVKDKIQIDMLSSMGSI